MPALLQSAQITVTAAFVLWMISGFTFRTGLWLRWKMFCRGEFTILTLTGTKDGREEEVNPYTYLSPGSFLLNPSDLQAIVHHLTRTGRYDRIDGTGRVLSVRGDQRIEVNDGQALERDIRSWIQTWNDNPRPFTWTKTADEILNSLADYLEKIAPPATKK